MVRDRGTRKSGDKRERSEPPDHVKDLEPRDESEKVRGGKPPRDPEPRPPSPGGPIPIPYPNN